MQKVEQTLPYAVRFALVPQSLSSTVVQRPAGLTGNGGTTRSLSS